ncbi:MAG TPA: hypothetical protein VF773_04855 [Verrucomicrobiae bacterium]
MAEAIIVHFSAATAGEILPLIAAKGEKVPDKDEYFLPNNAHYLLIVQTYSDREYQTDYSDEDRKQVEAALGNPPSLSLLMQLRRSKQTAACDAAEKLIRNLLTRFPLAVDDGQHIWTRKEIEITRARDLFEIYRHYEFLDRRRTFISKILAWCALGALLLRVIFEAPVLWLAVALLFASLALITTVKRCSQCAKRGINFGYMLPTYCESCGTPFQQ